MLITKAVINEYAIPNSFSLRHFIHSVEFVKRHKIY